MLDPEEAERLHRLATGLLGDGIPWEAEFRLAGDRRDSAGNRRWIRLLAEPARDPSGRIVALQGAVQEITRTKVLEQEGIRLGAQVTRVLEGMSDAFFSFDAEGRFTYLNSAALAILGVETDEALGRPFLEAFPEAAGSELVQRMAEARQTGRFQGFDIWAPRFQRWFRVQIFPSDEGLSIFFNDTSEIRQAMAALEEREARFRLVADLTTDAIWEWDLEADTVWWSEGVRGLFGHDPETLGKAHGVWTEFVHPEDRTRVLEALNQAIQGFTDGYDAEYRLRRADGTWAMVRDRARRLDDGEGAPRRMVGGLSDLTERRELEAQLLRTQRLEGIGTLAGGIAHDLNNVLAPVLLSLELLEEGLPDPEDRALLRTVEGSARRGAALVRQLLTFARGTRGERVEVDLPGVVAEVAALIRDTFPRGIELRVEMEADLPSVIGDPNQLHQAMLNLCVNARDAMPRGGALTLRLSRVEISGDVAARHADVRPGTFLRLSVRDSGEGMDPETLARIFDPFFTTKEPGKGTGLGLSTTLAIVRSHGGFLEVESEPGAGSAFRLLLPSAAQGPPAPATPGRGRLRSPGPSKEGAGRQILVVDDEPALLTVLAQALRHGGYEVVTASGGREGVAKYLQLRGRVDALVTDAMMAGMDGAALIHELRGQNPRLPVLATSGLAPGGALARLVEEAGVRFLQKPFAAGTLLDQLAALLEEPPRGDGPEPVRREEA